MSGVDVRIPGPLREYTGGEATVTVDGASTVASLFSKLCAEHPDLRARILTDQGEVRRHVNVFVGVENIRHLDGLETPVSAGEEVSIVPAVSGG